MIKELDKNSKHENLIRNMNYNFSEFVNFYSIDEKYQILRLLRNTIHYNMITGINLISFIKMKNLLEILVKDSFVGKVSSNYHYVRRNQHLLYAKTKSILENYK